VTYASFLDRKAILAPTEGIEVERDAIHPTLFDFQRDLVTWALRKGRSAIFADTGLGKSFMQIEWARLIGERTLILAPLAVAQQTIREASKLGVEIVYARNQAEAEADDLADGITITNYERLDAFDPSQFGAVVLDESSILKNFSGVVKKALVEAFRHTRYRLCCTATPAPNDIEELCNHADFLGVMTPSEMRSTFFIAETRAHMSKYRLKKHAKDSFYRWLASWGMSLRKPSDLGYPDDGYDLPPLDIRPVYVEAEWKPADQLFATGLKGVTERAEVRRSTVEDRVARACELVAAEPDESWLLWCGLNDESAMLTRNIEGAVEVQGSDSPEYKAEMLSAFADGDIKVVVTKPSLAGFGMNFQRCARMAFVGLGDSYEAYYQSIRRCWRFGQTRPVHAYVVLTDVEAPIYQNVLRKEQQARELAAELVKNVAQYERSEITSTRSGDADIYAPRKAPTIPSFLEAS